MIFSLDGLLKLIQISDSNFNNEYFLKEYFKTNIVPIKIHKSEINFEQLILTSFKNIIDFSSQYSCCNNKYRIDFYNDEFKLAVEYDEEHHKYNRLKDKARELEIHKELGCNFIRVRKGKELEGISDIFTYILNNKDGVINE